MAGRRLEALGHFGQHGAEGVDRDLALVRCRISTNRDMCVPLKLWGRFTYMLKFATVCCSPPERSLHPHRVIDVLDADLVDRDLAGVGAALDVLDRRDAWRCRARRVLWCSWSRWSVWCSWPFGAGRRRGFHARLTGIAQYTGTVRRIHRAATSHGRAGRTLLGPDRRDRALDAWRVEPGHAQAIVARAVLDEPVRDADVSAATVRCRGPRGTRRPRCPRRRRRRFPRA